MINVIFIALTIFSLVSFGIGQNNIKLKIGLLQVFIKDRYVFTSVGFIYLKNNADFYLRSMIYLVLAFSGRH